MLKPTPTAHALHPPSLVASPLCSQRAPRQNQPPARDQVAGSSAPVSSFKPADCREGCWAHGARTSGAQGALQRQAVTAVGCPAPHTEQKQTWAELGAAGRPRLGQDCPFSPTAPQCRPLPSVLQPACHSAPPRARHCPWLWSQPRQVWNCASTERCWGGARSGCQALPLHHDHASQLRTGQLRLVLAVTGCYAL